MKEQCLPRRPRGAQRDEAATKRNRNISRKDAKHVLLSRRSQRNNIYPDLAILRALAGKISESESFHMSENLRKPRKLSSIVV